MSVLSINHVLYDFASKYCTKSPIALLAWPGIRLTGRTFHPILNADLVLSKTISGGEFVPQLNRLVVLEYVGHVTVTGRSAEDVAVDSNAANDNVHVVRRLESRDENGGKKYEFVLYVFDENYNIKNVSALHFLTTTHWLPYVKIVLIKIKTFT